ncbi:MAG: hypothetical protein ACRD1H_18370 [Vicinamibacterales bacterium]
MMPHWRQEFTLTGRVVRVRPRGDGGWRVRLTDTGGALAAAEIRPSNPLRPPRVGAHILLRGHVRYDDEHGWYVVDPVYTWLEEHATARPV